MYSDHPSKFVINTIQPSCTFMEPNSLLSFLWQLNPFQRFSSLGAYTPVSLMYFPLKLSTKFRKHIPASLFMLHFLRYIFINGLNGTLSYFTSNNKFIISGYN